MVRTHALLLNYLDMFVSDDISCVYMRYQLESRYSYHISNSNNEFTGVQNVHGVCCLLNSFHSIVIQV